MSGDFVAKIFEAGVVGCGGAGFPTHVKLQGPAEWFIVNGAECEPLLRTDRYLMCHEAEALVCATAAIARHLHAAYCAIALKDSYEEEIVCLRKAIAATDNAVELCLLDSFYPAGDEQHVVQMATGRVVPAGGIPLDVGVVVNNVATVLAVADAQKGIPLTQKTLTVAGAVRTPCILQVPVGTPVAECIAAAGGGTEAAGRVIMGGPMMGRLLSKEEEATEVVTKTTSGILVLPGENPLVLFAETNVRHILNRARSACIQCTYCTMQCPRFLLGHPLEPHRIMRKLAYAESLDAMLDDEDVKQALICCECGVCELHACPMGLQPRRVNVLMKRLYAGAGIRYKKEDKPCLVQPELEWRKIPTERIAARTGISQYYHWTPGPARALAPGTVRIPLKQHIGAAAVPTVAVGDTVAENQLIAACPEKALGANIHTGIAGIVTAVDGAVTITRKEAGA